MPVFGCVVYPLLRPYNRQQFSSRFKQCIFMGYRPKHIGYRCFDKHVSKFYYSRHVEFDEAVFYFKLLHSGTTSISVSTSSVVPSTWLTLSTPWPQLTPDAEFLGVHSFKFPHYNSHASHENFYNTSSPATLVSPVISPAATAPTSSHKPTSLPSTTPPPTTPVSKSYHSLASSNTPESASPTFLSSNQNGLQLVCDSSNSKSDSVQAPPSPHIVSKTPTRTHHMTLRPTTLNKTKFLHHVSSGSPTIILEPSSFTIAYKIPVWCRAMQEEMAALIKNKTWILVPPPHLGNIIGNRWIYKVKYLSDGSIKRCKARFVAKGYSQEYGLITRHLVPLLNNLPFVQYSMLL